MNESKLDAQDDWHLVRDPKKRKQIQDRLAQRARRKRLAERKGADSNQQTKSCENVHRMDEAALHGERPSHAEIGLELDHQQTKPRPWTAAIGDNGKILGIPCGTMFARKSNPAIPGMPESLKPTLLQLSTVHWAWIDKFPFPDFRDEIILHSSTIDEEEFLQDLFAMEAFTIAPGAASWDPYAYSLDPNFQQKWGYLFPSFPMLLQFQADFS